MLQLIRRVRYAFQHRKFDADLVEEMDFHRAMKQSELEGTGLKSSDASLATRRALGSIALTHDHAHDVWMWPWLQDLWQDLRFATRLLTRHRSFTSLAVIVLALGIGVNGMFFTLVEMICIRGLPLHQPDRIMYLATRDARARNRGLSYPDFEDLRAATRTFTGIAAFGGAPMAVGDEGRAPDRFLGAYISADAFRLLGEAPMGGRDFRPEDDRPGASAVVILGSRVWKDRYGADPSAIGRTIRVNGVPTAVIGVMPDGFKFPINTEVWQPLASMPQLADQKRDVRALAVFGRLADRSTPTEAQAEVEAIAGRLSRDHPETNEDIRMTAVPINERYNGNIKDPTWLSFIAAGGLVLLIACANVANLLLTRSAQRSREIAIRASLGATRRRVVRQLLAESLLLAVCGGALGFGLAFAGLRLVSSFTPPDALPYWMDFTMDRRVLAFLATMCLGTTIIFGLVPALHLARTDVNGLLKDGGRTGSGGCGARRWTALFLIAQFALTLILLAHLAVGVRLFLAELRKDPPIDMARLLTTSVALPSQTYRTAVQRAAFYEQLDERLRGIGSVSSAAVASALPFGGASTRQLAIGGAPSTPRVPPPTVWTVSIGARYFETIGLAVFRGRGFDDRDGTQGHENAIVNQRFVEMYFPNVDPIGSRIRLTPENAAGPAPWLNIVGISPTVRQRPLPEPDPIVYVPYRTDPPAAAALILRGRSEPGAMVSALREAVRALDPDLPLYRMVTMEQAVTDSRWNGRVSSLLITMITCIALGLAAVGLYAVTAHAVVQRMPEIGIRIALGAQARQVRWLVLRRAMLQLGMGLVVGLACTILWERLFANYSGPDSVLTDPLSLILAATLLVVVAAAACLFPARRATRLDPIAALRYE